jgi:hypothetical protein
MRIFDKLSKAMQIAPYLNGVSEEQFKYVVEVCKMIGTNNVHRVPCFVFSEEMRQQLRALGMLGEIVVVQSSEAHKVAEMLNEGDAEKMRMKALEIMRNANTFPT